MDVKEAVAILTEKFPDKKINGNPVEYKGAYAFSLVPKTLPEGEPNWDSTITSIDKVTGKILQFDAFGEPDFWTDATPI